MTAATCGRMQWCAAPGNSSHQKGSLSMSQHHVLRASPETCPWGFFDAGLKPVLAVASGDTVTVDCVSGGPDVLPPEGKFEILPDHLAIQSALEPRLGAHILTGPISVAGA